MSQGSLFASARPPGPDHPRYRDPRPPGGPAGPLSAATVSKCGTYRYDLSRWWGEDSPARFVNFIMLNPSTADGTVNDPTIRRCMGFAEEWGYGGLVVTNLFAYRATDPRKLSAVDNATAVGPANDDYLERWARNASLVVCAWGNGGRLYHRWADVVPMLHAIGARPTTLRITAEGFPAHPLYLPADLRPDPM